MISSIPLAALCMLKAMFAASGYFCRERAIINLQSRFTKTNADILIDMLCPDRSVHLVVLKR